MRAAILLVMILAGCAEPVAAPRSVQLVAADTIPPGGFSFDQNDPIPNADLTDISVAGADVLQTFLDHTYYGTRSVLATYESNGVTAAVGIARAAVASRVNPFVLLALAEAAAQLVSANEYPSPSSLVEFTFACGCQPDVGCDASQGGFDRQIACVASGIRASLDAVGAGGCTPHGWCVGATKTSDDGILVTPRSAAAAALYERMGDVGVGTGGVWLIASLARKYRGP